MSSSKAARRASGEDVTSMKKRMEMPRRGRDCRNWRRMLRRLVPPTSEKVIVSPFLLMRTSSTRGRLANGWRGIVETCAVIIEGRGDNEKPTNKATCRFDVKELPRLHPVEKRRLARAAEAEEETSGRWRGVFAGRA